MSRSIAVCIALWLLVLNTARAGNPEETMASTDWPQWRGPRRDAVSTDRGLLQAWPKEGPPLLWTAKGLGRGYSSVSIAGGKIFTMGDRGKEQFLIALDMASQKELWAARVGQPWGDGGPRCTPTVDGDLVYGLSPHGDLVCVETASGKERWRKNLPRDFHGHMMSGWGYSESPLVDGDKLICTPGGREATLVALNKKTGEVIWRAVVPEGDGAGYASAVISQAAGIRQYVQLLGRGIVGVAAKDGKFLWRYNRIANGTANIPTPLVKDDLVFCSTGYDAGSALLRLIADGDGVKAEEVYFLKSRDLQNHHGGLVLVGDYVYGGHGHNNGSPVCVDLKSGKITWRKDRGPGSGSAAVVYADGELYFRYQDGLMALIEASPEGYKAKGTFKIPHSDRAPSWAHPVVAGGKLYLREQDRIMCYDLRQH
jgi:outer membrane protein assembly factor BamB